MNLLTGIAGTGKSLSIAAIWRAMYEIISETTGVPIEDLPPRVFRFLDREQFSVLGFGKSDRNIERFFDEILAVSSQKFSDPSGNELELPLLVILEELDGLGRARGNDSTYDRVMTTFLQRLDPNRPDLVNRHIIFIGTSNVSEQIDTAVLRRIGTTIENLGRLDRTGFAKVLEKQIANLPVEHAIPDSAHEAVVADLTEWLFSPNGSDKGVAELTYAGSTNSDLKFRRDFLTGALVNRSVKTAAEQAANEAYEGLNGSGIHLEHFVEAFNHQILATVDQLSEHNASRFVEVPDSARVARVRKIPQPSLFPQQLQSH